MSANPEWDLHCAEAAGDRAAAYIKRLEAELLDARARIGRLEREADEWFTACRACLEEITKLEAARDRARASAVMHAEQRTGWVSGKGYEPDDYWSGGA